MTKKQRAELVQIELEKLYPEVPIPLEHTDAYTLMVAVALSAQTTDKKVNQVTPNLFKVAGSPEKMAKLEVPEINRTCQYKSQKPEKDGRTSSGKA
jgi:endonuclease-3